MGKVISVVQNGVVINLYDDDNSKLEDYIKNITPIFSSDNIIILETKNQIFLARPSTIDSIKIEESVK